MASIETLHLEEHIAYPDLRNGGRGAVLLDPGDAWQLRLLILCQPHAESGHSIAWHSHPILVRRQRRGRQLSGLALSLDWSALARVIAAAAGGQ